MPHTTRTRLMLADHRDGRTTRRFILTLAVALSVLPGATLAAPATAEVAAVAPAASSGTEVTGTIVITNTTWPASGSPYRVTGPVQVAAGATLTIAAGAIVVVDSTFQLEGGLTLAGTDQQPVTVQSDVPIFRGIGAYNEPSRSVTITHADITGPGPLTGGDTKYLALALTDSTISDVTTTNYIWYPTDLLIERNVFTNVNTLEIGTRYSAIIRNNRFRQAPAGGFNGYNGEAQLVSWAAYGPPMQVTGNVFEESVRPRILEVSIDGHMDAPGNHFGSSDSAQVKNWVLDKEDDLNRKGVVGVEPLLTQTPAETPRATPTAARNVTATAGDGTVSLTWTAPLSDGGAPITGYTATATPISDTSAATSTLTTAPGTSTTTLTGLTNGAAYTVTLTATNAAGVSPGVSKSATPRGAPSAPLAPQARREFDAIRVAWTAPTSTGGSPVTEYLITAHPGGASRSVGAGGELVYFRDLTPETEYTFTVAALNAVGEGESSGPTNPVVFASVPDQVTSLRATRADQSATVSWSPAAPNGAPRLGYEVTATPGGRTITVGPDDTTAFVPGLINGRPYTFTVRAGNDVGYAPASAPSNAVTPAGRPGAAASLKATVVGRKVTLTWRPAPANGATVKNYQVLMDGKVRAKVVGIARKFVLSTAPKGRHEFHIRAVNIVGSGPLSSTVKVRIR